MDLSSISHTFPQYTTNQTNWNYGTAGFRGPSESLSPLFFKVGLFASLRALALQSPIGLMITASHNPPNDNGIKIVDPDGSIMAQDAEAFITQFVNSPLSHHPTTSTTPQNIIVGFDSRRSSPILLQPILDAINLSPNKIVLIGLTTTPCLHYSVFCHQASNWDSKTANNYYFNKFVDPFNQACSLLPPSTPTLYVDCANGVPTLIFESEIIRSLPYLKIFPINSKIKEAETLNVECGADFVKTRQRRPRGFDDLMFERCASFDGDADRIVYFSPRSEKDVLFDGDRILCLLIKFLKELLEVCQIEDFSFGAVQTAYANGASSDYIRNYLVVDVFVVPTGVKHLVKKAKELDLGIYFEANGHGSAVVSESLAHKVKNALEKFKSNERKIYAAKLLLCCFDVINPTIGDALSVMFLVEIALKYLNWSLEDWFSQFDQFPSKLMQVKVKDRFSYKTCDAERRLVSHEELQRKIDLIVGSVDGGRCFVRPSGTEDVVRIYSEAQSEEGVEIIANNVAEFVRNCD